MWDKESAEDVMERGIGLEEDRREWIRSREELVEAVTELGFPEALGTEIAKNLGSAKAMRRMTAYLWYVKPSSAEVIVDEMLAIRSEIEAWREKKLSEEANMKYNAFLKRRRENDGPGSEDENECL